MIIQVNYFQEPHVSHQNSDSFFQLQEEVISAEFEKQVGKIQDFRLCFGNNSRGVRSSTLIYVKFMHVNWVQTRTNNWLF
jgi:hypothetical protein